MKELIFYILFGIILYYIITVFIEKYYRDSDNSVENFDPSLVPVSSIVSLAKNIQKIKNGSAILTKPSNLTIGTLTAPGNLTVSGQSFLNDNQILTIKDSISGGPNNSIKIEFNDNTVFHSDNNFIFNSGKSNVTIDKLSNLTIGKGDSTNLNTLNITNTVKDKSSNTLTTSILSNNDINISANTITVNGFDNKLSINSTNTDNPTKLKINGILSVNNSFTANSLNVSNTINSPSYIFYDTPANSFSWNNTEDKAVLLYNKTKILSADKLGSICLGNAKAGPNLATVGAAPTP